MLKFALVGCGRIAKRHSELLGLGQIKGAALVAACDITEDKAAIIGKQFSVPHFTDMHLMMQSVVLKFIVLNGGLFAVDHLNLLRDDVQSNDFMVLR